MRYSLLLIRICWISHGAIRGRGVSASADTVCRVPVPNGLVSLWIAVAKVDMKSKRRSIIIYDVDNNAVSITLLCPHVTLMQFVRCKQVSDLLDGYLKGG